MAMQFKTNINCGGCLEQVKPHLDNLEEVSKWDVDTQNPDKILTIEGEADEAKIRQAVQEAGFEAKPVKKGFFQKLFG